MVFYLLKRFKANTNVYILFQNIDFVVIFRKNSA